MCQPGQVGSDARTLDRITGLYTNHGPELPLVCNISLNLRPFVSNRRDQCLLHEKVMTAYWVLDGQGATVRCPVFAHSGRGTDSWSVGEPVVPCLDLQPAGLWQQVGPLFLSYGRLSKREDPQYIKFGGCKVNPPVSLTSFTKAPVSIW